MSTVCNHLRLLLIVLLLCALAQPLQADDTFVYAVQISATVEISPPQITLQWETDPYGAANYTIFRKTRDATSWGNGISLPGSASRYTNVDVTFGSAYEYQIIKNASLGYMGSGYIYAGLATPLTALRIRQVPPLRPTWCER